MGFTPPKIPRARWILHFQAQFWRSLMSIGMLLHKLAPPRPPHPDWSQTISSTISTKRGDITLHFYVPGSYFTQKRLYGDRPGFGDANEEAAPRQSGLVERGLVKAKEVGASIRRRNSGGRKWGTYPVIINFHGGGFTLGHATDDARWCGTAVDECNAVVISVDYRLAPECAFPTAVEDGADAVLWVHAHAEELGVDTDKIALSGFSSGGNMAFTVPLRLYDELTGFQRDADAFDGTTPPQSRGNLSSVAERSENTGIASSSNNNDGAGDHHGRAEISRTAEEEEQQGPSDPRPRSAKATDTTLTTVTSLAPSDRHAALPEVKIRAIVPWYPSTDYTRTREQRKATSSRKDQDLPAIFTDLFDESYLHPPQKVNLDSPYLSPAVAPTDLLTHALPHEIIMHTCEWDMLLDEGVALKDRLLGECGKKVYYKMVPGVPHGWDKAPNPWKPTPGVREHYLGACAELRRVFGREAGIVEQPTLDGPSAAPRGSVQVVR